MQVELLSWTQKDAWNTKPKIADANLVIYFGGKGTLDSGERYKELKAYYPKAHVLGCSTGGEIIGDEVIDDSVVVAAIQFSRTGLQTTVVPISGPEQSFATGKAL